MRGLKASKLSKGKKKKRLLNDEEPFSRDVIYIGEKAFSFSTRFDFFIPSVKNDKEVPILYNVCNLKMIH